ncbi:MAG: 4Fe-4S dicluster domain-containing protein [Clostridiales bacterium]|jgi:heterodisulfide reductase subunit C|nr:4Fe-4S dicluster domain-containing protein [Clostridiales bacterium]
MLNYEYQLEEILDISGVDIGRCMKCGRCSASCPSYDEMEHRPHQFITYLARGDVAALLESDALWQCLACFSCVQRCPRDVKPANLIEAVRLAAIRPKGAEFLTVEEVEAKFAPDMPQQLLVAAFRKYMR